MTRTAVAVLVLGALPFCPIDLAFGYLVGPNSAPAVLNRVHLPIAFASGLWIQLSQLPEVVQAIAPLLPPYHLDQLALGVRGAADGGNTLPHPGGARRLHRRPPARRRMGVPARRGPTLRMSTPR